jgi:hypothetical protein
MNPDGTPKIGYCRFLKVPAIIKDFTEKQFSTPTFIKKNAEVFDVSLSIVIKGQNRFCKTSQNSRALFFEMLENYFKC